MSETEQQFGRLAAALGHRSPLQVCKSRAGYYVGTLDAEGLPISRESEEYWQKRELAERALSTNSFTQKRSP